MLKGRINRRTFIVGNLIALGVLIFVCLIIVLPIALLDIFLNGTVTDEILSFLYYLVAIPGIAYLFYICVLMVKRAHDLNLPGLLMVVGFVFAIFLAKITDINLFNLISLILLITLAFLPGSKTRNKFGIQPRKKLRLNELKIHVN